MTILQLRNDLRFNAQPTSGQWRCTLEDLRNQRFFRMGRREYLIASALDGTRALSDVASHVQQQLKQESPDVELPNSELVTLVESTTRWLLSTGLVVPAGLPSEAIPKTVSSGKAMRESAQEKLYVPAGDPFGFRIPFLSGDVIERWIRPLSWLFTWPVALAFILLVIMTGMMVAANPQPWMSGGAKLFVPEAAWWWLSAWICLKTIHETGHALACIAYGGRLRTAGLAFFYMAPLPFVDTTDMWRLTSRWGRMVCAMAGILAEIAVACIALLIGYSTEVSSIQYFCFSLATLGTLTTIAFNGNPLARFDGYFLMSDLLDRPNLWTEGQNALHQWTALGYRAQAGIPSLSKIPLALYGLACSIYRTLVLAGLAWGAWIAWQGLGLLLIAAAATFWFLIPLWKKHAKAPPAPGSPSSIPGRLLHHCSWLRISISSSLVLGVITAGIFIPSPYQPVSPGFVAYKDVETLCAANDSVLAQMLVADGDTVSEGQVLIELQNPHLELALKNAQMDLEIARERSRILRTEGKMSEYRIEVAKISGLEANADQLAKQVAQLKVVSPMNGTFQTSMRRQQGMFVKAGTVLGTVADLQEREILASIEQADAQDYRQDPHQPVIVYLDTGRVLNGQLRGNLPRGSNVLENAAMAARYGGPVAVRLETNKDNQTQLLTPTPRFEVRIALDAESQKDVALGQLCRVRLANRPTTLWNAAIRWLDALQRHFTEMPEAQPAS